MTNGTIPEDPRAHQAEPAYHDGERGADQSKADACQHEHSTGAHQPPRSEAHRQPVPGEAAGGYEQREDRPARRRHAGCEIIPGTRIIPRDRPVL